MQNSCRLCASPWLKKHFDVRGCTLDRCGTCGFVQVREQPDPEALKAIYSEGYFAKSKYDDKLAQARENERRLGLLRRAGVPHGARVLDAGCATGDFLAAAGQYFDMWGLDVSAFATDVARQQNPQFAHQIFTGFVEDQRFPPSFFDAIVMWDVIEHIWDPKAVLQRLVEHLKPGGVLILSTPDIGALTASLMRSRWAFMTPPEHLGFFSEPSLQFLLERLLGLRKIWSRANGKWANLGFIVYKVGRVFPGMVPSGLARVVQDGPLGRVSLYVPTGDIRYVAARKSEA